MRGRIERAQRALETPAEGAGALAGTAGGSPLGGLSSLELRARWLLALPGWGGLGAQLVPS